MKVVAKKKTRGSDFTMPKGSASGQRKKKSTGKPWPASVVSKAEYNYYVKEFKGFSFRIPAANETPKDTRPDELCIFNEYYKVGLTLPLPLFLVTFCNEGKILPGMLMPNTMAMLNGLYQFFNKWGVRWRLENMLSLLTLTEKNGLFYGQPKHSSEFKMIGIPSSRHGWKNRYFFVKSQEPWPITVGISPPHAQSFKGWGNSDEVVGLKGDYNNKPFCLHVGTLDVSPMDLADTKRKGQGERSSPAEKAKATEGNSEEEAKTNSSDEIEEGDEASIQWSEYEEEASPVEKPVEELEKPARKAVKKKKMTGGSSAVPSAPAAEVRETEAAPFTEDIPEVPTAHGSEIGAEQDIPSPMRRMFREESARRAGKEPEGSAGLAECYYSSIENSFYLKQNTKYRCIPDIASTEVPYSVSSIFLHPEDRNKLRTTSLIDLGYLQAQMSMGATQITKYLVEQLQNNEKERRRLHKDNESITAHYIKQRDITVEQREKLDSLAASLAEAKAGFERVNAKKNEELQLIKAQKEAAEEQLLKEREDWARKERINWEVVEGLKASIAKKAMISSSQQSKEEIIQEYKQSAEYESILKEFSEEGYIILKKYLEKNQLLTKDQLNKIDYDTCIEEASDEESDNR